MPEKEKRNFLQVLRDKDFPYRSGSVPMPYVLHSMFWVGFWMPVGAAIFTVLKVLAGGPGSVSLYGQDLMGDDLLWSVGVGPLAVACIGVALAYGIWSQRSYPRYLSVLVLSGAALWANVRMFQTLHISWEPVAAALAAVVSVKYLLFNPDVVEYYRTVRLEQRQRRALAAGQVAPPM